MSKRAEISAIALDPNHKVPVVLLKIEGEDRYIPIWIGMLEASSILVAMEGVATERPMSHDLTVELLKTCAASVERIEVNDLRDGTYYAEITLTLGGETHVVDARPSDALAIALRTEAEVWVHDRVLDQVQVEDADGDDEVEVAGEGDEAADGAGDEVRPEVVVGEAVEMDEEQMRDLLEKLDPDDFKYRQ